MATAVRRASLVACLTLLTCLYTATTAAADSSSPWLPGPDASGDDTFTGFIDSPLPDALIEINSNLDVRGWVVDRTASGWSGVDDVAIYLGLQEQGGTLLAHAQVGVPRPDVAAAFGNSYWANSGFSVSFANSGLSIGPNVLSIYLHAPDRGWWYRQVEVRMPQPPDRPYADDPLLIVREATPSLDVSRTTTSLTLKGYAIDRNMPLSTSVGVGGSGVSRIQFYLDGPRNSGTPLGSAALGEKNREATGFGDRFLNSGWEMTVHPSDFSVDRHELYLYALSAYWPTETLVIIPFNVRA
jgi:hypothetical protein